MFRSSISTIFTIVFLIHLITAGYAMAGNSADTPIAACEIVTQEAVKVLPAPLRPFFDAHLDQIRKFTPSVDNDNPESHYVLLDASAISQPFEDRLKAARLFPRNMKLAQNLFRNNDLQDQGGQLPWAILDHFEGLTLAFQSGDENKITEKTASLLHLITDACWPMNTTVDRFESTQQIQSSTMSRIYMETALAFDPLRRQLAYEVRVSPSRYKKISDPVESVFDELFSSYKTLLEIDKAVKNNRTSERLARIFEQRLESAALLAACLIGTAWENANKPILTAEVSQSRQPISSTPQKISLKTSVQFLGSKNSGIFHRSTCMHAKRIKSGNIVRFSSSDEALQAGRKGCKTCKSDSKSP